MKFHSLTHARAVRERLAHIASGDPITAASIESICRAEGDFRKTIKDVQHGCMMRWDGNGVPRLDLPRQAGRCRRIHSPGRTVGGDTSAVSAGFSLGLRLC